MYMQHLGLLERVFPSARFVHLIRDGRDAAVSYLAMPAGVAARTLANPGSAAAFACQWRAEVKAARALGRRVGDRYLEVRYEGLVERPKEVLRQICDFAALPWDATMLGSRTPADVSEKVHQQSLHRPLTPGLRDWRKELAPSEQALFEAVAGDLLAELGYELTGRRASVVRAGADRAWFTFRRAAWHTTLAAVHRSPLWRRRHPRLV